MKVDPNNVFIYQQSKNMITLKNNTLDGGDIYLIVRWLNYCTPKFEWGIDLISIFFINIKFSSRLSCRT